MVNLFEFWKESETHFDATKNLLRGFKVNKFSWAVLVGEGKGFLYLVWDKRSLLDKFLLEEKDFSK